MLLYRNGRTMSVVIVFILQLLLMTVTAQVEEETEELRQLHILFRHGDRTPTAFFGDDPYASFDYPEGVGGLTLAGKERLHRVGAALRAHFQAKLESLPPRNIEAQSSPKRRVVESALALLAGFAPPKSAQEIWSNKSDLGSRWQPVAVQTASPGRAWLLGEGGCPEVDRLIPLAHSLPLTVETWDAAVEFRGRLTSSMNVTFPLWSDLATLYDTVICEQEYFSRLGQWLEPAWIQGAGPGTMEQLAVFRRLQFTIYGLLPMEYKRLQAGPFLKEVIAKMKSPSPEDEGGAEEGGPQKKVFLYGTHDTVMAPILHVLGVFQGQPSYGSGLVLELLASSKSSKSSKSQNRTTTVRMSFFNVTADDVRFSALPFNSSKTFSGRCSAGDCDLESVEESLRQYLPVDIELECGLKSGNEDSRNSSRTTVLLLVVALVLAIAGNVGLLSAQCCASSSSPKRSGYQTM